MNYQQTERYTHENDIWHKKYLIWSAVSNILKFLKQKAGQSQVTRARKLKRNSNLKNTNFLILFCPV